MYFYRSVHFRIGSPARWSSVFLFLLLQAETSVLVRVLQQVTEHQEQIWMWEVADLNKAAVKGDHFAKLRENPASAFTRVSGRAGNSLSCCHLLFVVCLCVSVWACAWNRCHKASEYVSEEWTVQYSKGYVSSESTPEQTINVISISITVCGFWVEHCSSWDDQESTQQLCW